MCPSCFEGDGTVPEAGTYATHGLRKRGSVVNRAIASAEPGSGVAGAIGPPARTAAAVQDIRLAAAAASRARRRRFTATPLRLRLRRAGRAQLRLRAHHAALDDVAELAEVPDVARRVGGDDQEVGALALLDRPEVVEPVHGQDAGPGRGAQDFHGRLPGRLYRLHLGVHRGTVQGERVARVGPHGDGDAG